MQVSGSQHWLVPFLITLLPHLSYTSGRSVLVYVPCTGYVLIFCILMVGRFGPACLLCFPDLGAYSMDVWVASPSEIVYAGAVVQVQEQ